MDVKDASFESLHQFRSEDTHEPGEREEFNVGRSQNADQQTVVGGLALRRRRVHEFRGNVAIASPLQRTGIRPIRHDQRDSGSNDGVIEERRKVRSDAGGQDSDSRVQRFARYRMAGPVTPRTDSLDRRPSRPGELTFQRTSEARNSQSPAFGQRRKLSG